MLFFISLIDGAFFIVHESPLHVGMSIPMIARPTMKLKNTANFSVFRTSYILLALIRMFHHFRVLPFVVGLALGGVLYYFYKPEKQLIRQYPHPEDADKKIFKDHNNTCYTYSTHVVDCDANEATIKDYPIQA